MLKKSKLVDVKLVVRDSEPLDPFYLLMIFWNPEAAKSIFKVIRLGVNR